MPCTIAAFLQRPADWWLLMDPGRSLRGDRLTREGLGS